MLITQTLYRDKSLKWIILFHFLCVTIHFKKSTNFFQRWMNMTAMSTEAHSEVIS